MPSQDPLLTDMRHAPGWYAILPPPAPANRLKGQQTADWVVVGAGVTGLAAARRLAELAPEARIILLEEYRVGYGSSGRNSGFIIDTPYLTEQLGVDANRRISRLVVAGLAELEGHARKHAIDCEWSPRGHLTAVVESKREKRLHALCRTLDASDETYEWLDGDALADVVGTRHYHAAVNTPRTVLINPAALCRGLGETMPDNVEVCEESPVLRVEPGSPVRVECAEGSISAANVLLTTNAFITKLGFLKGDVFPMISCASLSRPLTEDEQAAMSGAPDWGITGGATVRRTLSNRMLARHGSYYTGDFRLSPNMRRELLASHLKGLRARFPMLDKLEFETTWAGVFCMTRNWASIFGRLERGVFASLGYPGSACPGARSRASCSPNTPWAQSRTSTATSRRFPVPSACRPNRFSVSGSVRVCGGTTGAAGPSGRAAAPTNLRPQIPERSGLAGLDERAAQILKSRRLASDGIRAFPLHVSRSRFLLAIRNWKQRGRRHEPANRCL